MRDMGRTGGWRKERREGDCGEGVERYCMARKQVNMSLKT